MPSGYSSVNTLEMTGHSSSALKCYQTARIGVHGEAVGVGLSGGKLTSDDDCDTGGATESVGKKRRNHTMRQQMLNKQAQQRFR